MKLGGSPAVVDRTWHRESGCKKLITDRGRETQRLHKVLEDRAIKLDSVASDAIGLSGRAMIEALVAGERDPMVLADLAKAGSTRRSPT
jgi:hypothetical protein